MPNSIAGSLRYWLLFSVSLSFFFLLLFVLLDLDSIFDARYLELGISGPAAEVGDHVVLPILVLLPSLLITLRVALRRSLAPLGTAARRIDAAGGMDRGFRVPMDDLPEEAGRFVAAVNDLLRRLDESAERQEAFAADIAHELKTPLAILQLELEANGDPLAGRMTADLKAMNRLIDQLLLIAQLDAHSAARPAYETVDLSGVACDVVRRLTPLAAQEGRALEVEILAVPMVHGRREAIAAALRNLIENAVRVTPPGGTVTVVVGPLAELRVRDGGPGLTAARLAEVSQRLSRADHASPGGAGLGLGIVGKVMASHGGRLTTRPEDRELRLEFRAAA
jgi:two-component system OmpR family sensor kinase